MLLRLIGLPATALPHLLRPYGMTLAWHAPGQPIPGSYWGECEAGLIGNTLQVRPDTPLHSALHEAGHFICMDAHRRRHLYRDAGGDELEECAVNYLQILLADALPGVDRVRLCADMDTWGYSFRLGSALAWFEHDAEDARQWLLRQRLIDADNRPTGCLRDSRPKTG